MENNFEKISIQEKMRGNPNFQKGVELFRKKHNLPPVYFGARKLIDDSGEKLKPNNTVYYRWYRKLITAKELKHNEGLRVLRTEGGGKEKRHWVAFRAVVPPEGCLELRENDFREKSEEEINVNNLFGE